MVRWVVYNDYYIFFVLTRRLRFVAIRVGGAGGKVLIPAENDIHAPLWPLFLRDNEGAVVQRPYICLMKAASVLSVSGFMRGILRACKLDDTRISPSGTLLARGWEACN